MQNTYASNRLAIKQWHVVSGAIDVGISSEEAEKVKSAFLELGSDQYELSDGTMIARLGTAVMDPAKYDDYYHRRNGETKCHQGNWHSKGQKCECQPKTTFVPYYCDKCEQGWMFREDPDPQYKPRSLAWPCECNPNGQSALKEYHDQIHRDPHLERGEIMSNQRISEARYPQLKPNNNEPAVMQAREVFAEKVSVVDEKAEYLAEVRKSQQRELEEVAAEYAKLDLNNPNDMMRGIQIESRIELLEAKIKQSC